MWIPVACIAGVLVTLAVLWFVGAVVEVAFDRREEDLRFEYSLFGSILPIGVAVFLGFTSLPAWAIFLLVPIGSIIVGLLVFAVFIMLRYGGRILSALAEVTGRKLREVVTDWRFHRDIDR
jgi:hypothetical protein